MGIQVSRNLDCDGRYVTKCGCEYYEDGVVIKTFPGHVHRTAIGTEDGDDYSLWTVDQRKGAWETHKKARIQRFVDKMNTLQRTDHIENPNENHYE